MSMEIPLVQMMGSTLSEVKGRGDRPSVIETLALSIEMFIGVLGDKLETFTLSILNNCALGQ